METPNSFAGKELVRYRMQRVAMVLAVFLLLAVSGLAQKTPQYLLRADPSVLNDICNRYDLVIVKLAGPPSQVVVTGPNSLSPDQLVAQVQADSRVYSFELDIGAQLPEIRPNPQWTPSIGGLPSATNGLSLTPFYGDLVWTAYLNQPFMAQINLQLQAGSRLTKPVQNDTPGFGVVVAEIDTGVDPTHPALQGALLPGYDFTRNQPGGSELADLNQSTAAVLGQSTAAVLGGLTATQLNAYTVALLDQSTAAVLGGNPQLGLFGHGTMVAGLIRLVAPGALIMPLKAFDATGNATLADIINAIYYAVDNGANVINMSFSQSGLSGAMLSAINYADRHGVICVASAGNDALQTTVYPAGMGYVIGVASVSLQGTLSTFSNYGPDVTTLAAPGEGLITAYPGAHYAAVWGTSFSAALVSGYGAVGIWRGGVQYLDHNETNLVDVMDAISSVHPFDPVLAWGVLNVQQMSDVNLQQHHVNAH